MKNWWLSKKPGLIDSTSKECREDFLELLGGSALGLLGEGGVDVGNNTTGGDGGLAKEAVQLLVVLDGQLDVAWVDAVLLHLLSGVAGEFEDFRNEVLHDGGHVHGGTGADALGVATFLEEAAHAADGKGQAGPGGGGLASASLLGGFAGTLGGHDVIDLSDTISVGSN